MGKLTERLKDPSRSGVYRTTRIDAVEDAVRGTRLSLVRIPLDGAAAKDDVLKRIAGSLAFPQWFGGNWDALEDCLTDLAWRPADGHVLVFEKSFPGDVLGVLIDVLAASAESWSERGKPFFAVFVDPDHALGLPDLFREP
jgi:hypothetical protein